MRAGLAAVHVLRDRGVRYAFCVPGESFLGLLDALVLTPEIQLVATRHEGGAAFMADAVGKLTGQPALCMGTRGVGTANLAVGIHTAQQDSTPLIAMVGQVETGERHREALQEVELAQFLGPITKWAVEAPTGALLPRLTSEAYRRSVSGRPGPVAIAVRGDILDQDASDTLPVATAFPVSAPEPAAIERALDLLAAASNPLIVAGGGVLRANAVERLVQLAEITHIPVMTAFRRLDAFPNDHPRFAGTLSFAAPPSVRRQAAEADVVLAIGTRLSELTTLGYTIPSPSAALIHVDISPDETGRAIPATVAIAACAGATLDGLLAGAANRAWPVDGAPHAASPVPSTGGRFVDPAIVVAALNAQLPAHAVITSDAGNFYGWVALGYQFRQPGTFLGPTSGAMGYAVPAAVAAALVRGRETPVVATAGDGGFLMTANELATAAMLDLPVKCVVFDNALYGTIRLHQERAYPGRVAATELRSPDLVTYAEAFGGTGFRVERNEDVPGAVQALLATDGIGVLQVMVDRETIAAGQQLSAIH